MYGLEGSRRGAQTLRVQCVRYASDPEVTRLLVETNKMLGMEPTALRRYLEQLRAEAAMLHQPSLELLDGRDLFFRPVSPMAPEEATAFKSLAALSDRPPTAGPTVALGAARGMGMGAALPNFGSWSPLVKPSVQPDVPAAAPQAPPAAPAATDASPSAIAAIVAPFPREAAGGATGSSGVKLSQSRAKGLIQELEMGLRGLKKRLQNQLQSGRAPSKDQLASNLRKDLVTEVLAGRYGFEGTDEGLRLASAAVRPFLADLGMEARAEAVFRELGLGEQKEAQQHAPAQAAASAVAVVSAPSKPETPLPKISSDEAMEFHNELLESVTAPLFQKKLSELYRSHKTSSYEFARQFSELAGAQMEGSFKKYGLPTSKLDLGRTFLALGSFFADEDAQAVLSSIDEALFGAERSSPGSGPRLDAVVGALRQQLAGFSSASFQNEIRHLQEKAVDDKAEGYFRLPGRAELALGVQQEVLPAFGFEGSRRGVHALLAHASQLGRIAHVAGLLDAINAQLGMEVRARRQFRSRISELSAAAAGA